METIFGLPINEAQLVKINIYRKALQKPKLNESPGLRFLSYGANKDGYWTHDMFMEQLHDVLDLYEALFPLHQVAIEVDWSSGHAA